MSAALAVGLLPSRPGFTDSRLRTFAAAVRLFGAHGYHGVSVRDLADELGVKAPAMYAHVASKQDLLFQLVMIGVEEHRDRIRGALLDAGTDPEDQVAAVVRAHVLVHLAYQPLARLSHREVGALDEAQVQAVRVVRDESVRLFREVIERGCERGAFVVDDLDLAIFAITAMGVRAAEWWDPAAHPPADAVADAFVGYALKILR